MLTSLYNYIRDTPVEQTYCGCISDLCLRDIPQLQIVLFVGTHTHKKTFSGNNCNLQHIYHFMPPTYWVLLA
jgi:hypothetical protein